MKKVARTAIWLEACALLGVASGGQASVEETVADLPVNLPALPKITVAIAPPESLPLPVGRWTLCGGVSLVQTVDTEYEQREPIALGLIELFGSAEDFLNVMYAEEVIVAKLSESNSEAGAESVRGELPEKQAALVAAMLTLDDAYDWNNEVPAHVQYDFQFEWRGRRPVFVGRLPAEYTTRPHYEYRIELRRRSQVVFADLATDTKMVRVSKHGSVVSEARMEFGFKTIEDIIARFLAEASGENKGLTSRQSQRPQPSRRVLLERNVK